MGDSRGSRLQPVDALINRVLLARAVGHGHYGHHLTCEPASGTRRGARRCDLGFEVYELTFAAGATDRSSDRYLDGAARRSRQWSPAPSLTIRLARAPSPDPVRVGLQGAMPTMRAQLAGGCLTILGRRPSRRPRVPRRPLARPGPAGRTRSRPVTRLGHPQDRASFRRGRITRRIPARCAASTFSLIPPTGRTAAAQRDLAGHGQVRADRLPAPSDASAVRIATPADGPSLGIAPAGTCRWTVVRSNTPGSIPSSRGVRPDEREGRLGALPHHVAQHPGQDQPLVAARHAASPRRTARRRPTGSRRGRSPRRAGRSARRPRRRTGAARGRSTTLSARQRAPARCAPSAISRATFRQSGGDLPVQVPHARLAGVPADDRAAAPRPSNDELVRAAGRGRPAAWAPGSARRSGPSRASV